MSVALAAYRLGEDPVLSVVPGAYVLTLAGEAVVTVRRRVYGSDSGWADDADLTGRMAMGNPRSALQWAFSAWYARASGKPALLIHPRADHAWVRHYGNVG